MYPIGTIHLWMGGVYRVHTVSEYYTEYKRRCVSMCKEVSIDAVVVRVGEARIASNVPTFVSNCMAICSEYGAKGYTLVLDEMDDEYFILASEEDASKLACDGDIHLVKVENEHNCEVLVDLYGDISDYDLGSHDIALSVRAIEVVEA